MKADFEKFNMQKPFFFEGAFGTYYYKKNANTKPCEYGNIDNGKSVFDIHLEYIKAGVSAIKTNTFGANFVNFPDRGLRDEIISKGYEIALEAASGEDVKVFADIGYIYSEDSQDVLWEDKGKEEYISIAEKFLSLGATNFIFETLSDYDTIIPALSLIKEKCPNAFVVVSFAVSQDGFTGKGLYYKNLISEAADNINIDVAGLNCVCGPSHLKSLMDNLSGCKKPLCAMPNSGYPSTINGRTVFQDNAQYFAQRLNEIFKSNVYFLGGCCGTTPEHMRLAIKEIKSLKSKDQDDAKAVFKSQENKTDTAPAKSDCKSGQTATGQNIPDAKRDNPPKINVFADKLAKNIKVIAVEIDPPANGDIEFIMEASAKAKAASADLITVADSPLARTRADSIMLAAKIKREISIDVLPHLSCRDKNHIGIKASLLGGAIENINNVLAVTGDPVPSTDRNEIKGVFSFNSFSLISYISTLNEEVFADSPMLICAALNVNSINFKAELSRAEKKQELGAKVFFTQPIYSRESVINLELAKKTLKSKILIGLMPVASYRNAMFLNNEVSGIDIPDDFIESLKDKAPGEVFELSLDFEMDLVKRTIGFADGYYLMTPLKRIDLICELIKRIKEIF